MENIESINDSVQKPIKFALITEGISEYRVIKHIILRYLKDKEPIINQIQPKLIDNKQENTGGWMEVLKYCERTELVDILTENDYLVIQIDTDLSQTLPYNISHTKSDNSPKTNEELFEEVIAKLQSLFIPEIKEKYLERIFFAICIHTIECWLLPIYSIHHKGDTSNCLDKLNKELRKKGIHIITEKNSPQSQRTYEKVLNECKKPKEILEISKHQFSFNRFLDYLNLD